MVEILVNTDRLDLFPNEIISITEAINELSSIKSRNGGYSNSFKIPNTANNSGVLGFANIMNLVTDFKPTKSRNARLLKDGLEVQRGVIQVEEYSKEDESFTISFFSGNSEWIDQVGKSKMTDLDFSEYDHVFNAVNVQASFSNTSGYVYPFINYGRWNTKATNNVDLLEFAPAMFVKDVIKKIYSSIGFKTSGSFMNDALFNKVILPFSRKQPFQNKDVQDKFGLEAKLPKGSNIISGIVKFPEISKGNEAGLYDPSTGIWTSNGEYSIKVTASLSQVVGTNPIFSIEKNGGTIKFIGRNSATSKIQVVNGDTIRINANFTPTPNLNPFDWSLGIEIENRVLEGQTQRMTNTMPDLDQAKFISNIFNMFGVVFRTDNVSKTVYLDKFEVIKNNIPNAVDWTNKSNLSRGLEIDYTDMVGDYGKTNLMIYAEDDSDTNLVEFFEEGSIYFGDGSFDIDNDFIDAENEQFESDFAPTINTEAFTGLGEDIIIPYIPRWVGGTGVNNPDNEPEQRILINAGLVDVEDVFQGLITDIDIQANAPLNGVTQVPYAYFNVRPTGIDQIDSVGQCLSFGDNVTPKQHRNLIEENYKDYISILNNPRRATGYFLLNDKDVNELDFLTPVYLGGEVNGYFYINQIKDYRPNEGNLTEVELVLIR